MFRKKLTSGTAIEDPQFSAARQLFFSQWGNALITNRLLKFTVFSLCLVTVGMLYLSYKAYNHAATMKPLIIRIDEIGRAEALTYQSLEHKPQEREVKFFLSQFCRLYFSRNHTTLGEDFTHSMFFLEGKLANNLLDQVRKAQVLEKFLQDPNLPELDIEVRNVVLDPIETPPYRAKADLIKSMVSRYARTTLKRSISTVTFNYMFREKIESNMIPINPLGLTITYFREDEAFSEPSPQITGEAK